MPRVCRAARRRAARQSAHAKRRSTRGRLTKDPWPTSSPQADDGSRTRLEDSVVADAGVVNTSRTSLRRLTFSLRHISTHGDMVIAERGHIRHDDVMWKAEER